MIRGRASFGRGYSLVRLLPSHYNNAWVGCCNHAEFSSLQVLHNSKLCFIRLEQRNSLSRIASPSIQLRLWRNCNVLCVCRIDLCCQEIFEYKLRLVGSSSRDTALIFTVISHCKDSTIASKYQRMPCTSWNRDHFNLIEEMKSLRFQEGQIIRVAKFSIGTVTPSIDPSKLFICFDKSMLLSEHNLFYLYWFRREQMEKLWLSESKARCALAPHENPPSGVNCYVCIVSSVNEL